MKHSGNNSKSDQIKKDLQEAFSIIGRRVRNSRVLVALSVFLISVSLLIITEQFFYLSSEVKISALIISLFLGAFSYFRTNPYEDESFSQFYKNFARSQEIDELNYYLDLEEDNASDPELVKAALESNLSSIDKPVFDQKLSSFVEAKPITSFFKKSLQFGGLILVLLLTTGFIFFDGTKRTLNFWETFEKPNPYSFTIAPGNITLEQGSPFSATISFSNSQVPEELTLFVKTEAEEEFRSLNMEMGSSGFSSLPFNLNNDMEYFVRMDGFDSEIYEANVQLRPRFKDLQAVVDRPNYTKLDSTVQSYPFSLIRAYQGSEISLKGLFNKEIAHLKITSSLTGNDSLSNLNQSFTKVIEINSPDTISFSMTDKNGLMNSNSFQFTIEPITDEFPVVELIEPNASFEMVEPKLLDITFKSTDDFGITNSKLQYELKKAYVEQPTTGEIKLNTPPNGVLQQYSWDLSELNLSPLDELTFWIESTDNDEYNGWKSSQSQVLTLTVPSLVDYFESLDEKEDEVETDLEDVSESFDELSETYEEFKESLKENPNPDYENKRQLEEAEKKQQEVQEKIDQLNEKFEQIKEELSENNLLSEETQKTYEELKKLMEEIDDPDLQEALQKLRENLEQMTPEQLRRAMEEVEFNEEDYRKRLERTIELFKQLKLMSDMEKLAKSFEDQARQEQELSENPPSDQEAENKRKEDLDQIEKMQKALEELSENTSDKNERSVSEFQKETNEELNEEVKKKIEEWLKKQEQNSSGSEDDNKSDSNSGDQEQKQNDQQNQEQQPQQPNLQENFEKLAEKTRSMMKSMGGQQQQINIAGLQYILSSLLTLSTEQEDLVYLSQQTEDRSLGYIELARDQKNLDQIYGALSDSLFELSKTIPQFSNIVNTKSAELKRRLERSTKQMAERNQRNSSVASRQAFGGINEIAFMIANLLEQLQNQKNSGKGDAGSQSLQQMMEQMGEMRGNQQQLNQQLQQMINDMQGERLSQDQMERLDQIAKQQNRIRKQLQEMRNQGGLEGDRMGSEIERMIEEMEDTINDLRGGAVDPTLIERQQNILTRMLDAEEAMQERDEEEKEREAKRPGDFDQTTPPEMTLEELEKQIRARLNDPNFTKYSSDYQRLIERYFELLKQLQERNS